MGKPKGCIFVVDDQKAIVESIEAQFHCLGYEVIKATDPKRALELSDQIRPDLIITDIRMPRLDGISLIRKLKESQPEVKVIIVTGYYVDYEKDIKKLRDERLVEGDIHKPFYARDLEKLVREVLHPGETRPPKQIHSTNILIVDDEIEVTDFLKEYFREQGYAATSAPNVDEALLIFENFHPDVVITDIKMPGKNGIELIKEIREKDKRVQFIVMTGQSHHLALQELKRETGIEEFISKPIGLREIEQLVERLNEMTAAKKTSRAK